jgi:hypothetical protein
MTVHGIYKESSVPLRAEGENKEALARRRILKFYGDALDHYTPPCGGKTKVLPPKKKLFYLLSEAKPSHAQIQAALYVCGYQRYLGPFGPEGDGIDGKWGKHSKKAFEEFMKDHCIQDIHQAYDHLMAKARTRLMGQAKRHGWKRIEYRLHRAKRTPRHIREYRKIYREMWQFLKEDAEGSPQRFLRGEWEFFRMSQRMAHPRGIR